jgi:hypothetical protein
MTITTLPPRDPTLAPEPESAMKNGRIDLLDHGFVRLVDSMGDDLSVVRAARVSYDAAWRSGEDQGKDRRLIVRLWKDRHTSLRRFSELQVIWLTDFSGSRPGQEPIGGMHATP